MKKVYLYRFLQFFAVLVLILLLPSCLLSNQSSMIAERQCINEGIYPIFVNNDKAKFSIIKKANDYYLEGRIVTYKLIPPRYKKNSYFYKRGAKDQVVQYSQELRYYKLNRNSAVRFLQIYGTSDIPLQWRDENLFKEVLYNYQKSDYQDWIMLNNIDVRYDISFSFVAPFCDSYKELRVVPIKQLTSSVKDKYFIAPVVFVVVDIPLSLYANVTYPLISGAQLIGGKW